MTNESRLSELGPGLRIPSPPARSRVELEKFFLEGDPHACGIIWDLTIDEQKGELFVLCEPKRVGGVGECASLIGAERTREPSCR